MMTDIINIIIMSPLTEYGRKSTMNIANTLKRILLEFGKNISKKNPNAVINTTTKVRDFFRRRLQFENRIRCRR